jgi:hypothetical protein
MNRPFYLMLAVAVLLSPRPTIADPPERTSTISQRERVNVTVYNGAMSLVHDRRRIRLTSGLNRIAWRDVSARMDATSAVLHNVSGRDDVHVMEQNFNFDLLDPSALLEKYVGRQVTVVHEARFTGEHDTRERAKLLSTNGGVVLQYRDRIETALRGYIIYPAAPKNFRDRPTLDLDLYSKGDGLQTLDLAYLTSGLSWRADYVGVLMPDEVHMSITGLVTLSNTSGVSYDNAHLQLVAGNVNAPPAGSEQGQLKTIASVNAYSARRVQQENYFEYHLYTFPRPTTILDKQTKQLTLLTANDIPIHKTLELRGSPYYYQNPQSDLGDRLPVGVYVSFVNKDGQLGIPLPAGTFRIYKNDSRGLSQFVGADYIDHTPKNETVRLHLGDAFDVTAHKRQTDFQFSPGGNCQTDSSYEITLMNAKTIAQNVLVVEPIPGQWTILDENYKHTKSSAFTANWNIVVPPGGKSVLTYIARTKWCG